MSDYLKYQNIFHGISKENIEIKFIVVHTTNSAVSIQ